MSAEILHTREFRKAFHGCVSRRPRILRVAVPYIGKIPQLSPSIVELSRDLILRGCEEIQLITLPPVAPLSATSRQRPRCGEQLCQGRATSHLNKEARAGADQARTLLTPEADAISAFEGFNLMILPRLHSKVYQFVFPEGDRAAFVGSANLTAGGLERNVESVAFFREKADNDAVANEIERIAHGAHMYPAWKMHNSKEQK